MHLPAAQWWKLALRGEMEVYCCVEPARGSLIKLSPGSWNVISSFVIRARIICLHFACDGLPDNNGLGCDDAEAVLMVEGSRRSQTVTKKNPSDLSHLEIGNLPENFFSPRSIRLSGFFLCYIILRADDVTLASSQIITFHCVFFFPLFTLSFWLICFFKIKLFWLLELHCAFFSPHLSLLGVKVQKWAHCRLKA